MRWLPLVLVGIAVPAYADVADDLVTEGQRLGKAGRLREAVAKFREAERAQPRAQHDCLIGLAYARANQWSAAEIAFAACRARATAADPAPDWAAAEEAALASKLATYGQLAVTLVAPLESIQIAAVSEETFVPARPFHVPVGSHVIVARTNDGRQVRETVDVTGSGASITIALPTTPVVAAPKPKSRAPTVLLWGGAGLIVLGGIVHAAVVWPAYGDLQDAKDDTAYDDAYPKYRNGRIVAGAAYVVGAALAITGFVMRTRHKEAPVVGAQVDHESAIFTLEWQR